MADVGCVACTTALEGRCRREALNLGVHVVHGTKCEAISYWCLVDAVRYEVRVSKVCIAKWSINTEVNNIGKNNPQVCSLMK